MAASGLHYLILEVMIWEVEPVRRMGWRRLEVTSSARRQHCSKQDSCTSRELCLQRHTTWNSLQLVKWPRVVSQRKRTSWEIIFDLRLTKHTRFQNVDVGLWCLVRLSLRRMSWTWCADLNVTSVKIFILALACYDQYVSWLRQGCHFRQRTRSQPSRQPFSILSGPIGERQENNFRPVQMRSRREVSAPGSAQ